MSRSEVCRAMRATLGQIALRSRRVTSYRFPSSIYYGMPGTYDGVEPSSSRIQGGFSTV